MCDVLLLSQDKKDPRIEALKIRGKGYRLVRAESIEEAKDLLVYNNVELILLCTEGQEELKFCETLSRKRAIPYLSISASDSARGIHRNMDRALQEGYIRNAGKSFGDVTLDTIGLRAFVNGKDLELTQKEYAMLAILVNCEGRAVPRSDIYKMIWGDEQETQALRTTSSRLKRKLERHSHNVELIYDRLTGFHLALSRS